MPAELEEDSTAEPVMDDLVDDADDPAELDEIIEDEGPEVALAKAYGTGIARSRSPFGPFTKRSGPILKSNAKWSGPGHNSVVRTGGRAYVVYHAWRGAHDCGDDGSRQLMLDPITWKGGWPSVNAGTPSRGVHAAPIVP